ncbi:N-(5'-phosphoribosyl)anthranilate isomerase [Brevirhabdus pacifica]|uniref:N-(5'-phosphoribosyl)anthranilate isomerase n=1 Tax=Brevirhabdus pacifica TaxID=1267768 RepID=A0A1U7DKE6_9RHOB|nr:phosphoribosylanthranilate isomerase [Brevirhabdus pacifica]APX90460.1 N-(5'-phosphoribosyl)anthranilate isomerase [Brevirhabdus pacifica]OWU78522.1 N-(5'-phosphoribosyl)anthranilate isomerase [Loktanella sp. 22II-4b]PJJ85439.1 phosphoribosylanthranilate isomerase [Brevirhabdus pacifica]
MTSADPRIKFCGLRTEADIAVAVAAGATYVGFVFFDRSPRAVSVDEARALALAVPAGIAKVALTVDPDDATLDRIVQQVPLDMIQLHGHETPERVAELRARHGLPVMKAIGVADAADLEAIERYEGVADQLLIDARPPRDAVLPGGNGLKFDWRLIEGRDWRGPWMLAGGLDVANVAEAIARTGARQIDVSSGVESAPGQKDAAKMAAFAAAARGESHA